PDLQERTEACLEIWAWNGRTPMTSHWHSAILDVGSDHCSVLVERQQIIRCHPSGPAALGGEPVVSISEFTCRRFCGYPLQRILRVSSFQTRAQRPRPACSLDGAPIIERRDFS